MLAVMTDTAGQWYTLSGSYGRHPQTTTDIVTTGGAKWGNGRFTPAGFLHKDGAWSVTLTSPLLAEAEWPVAHALSGCCGQHRRPVARSKWLLWPTSQACGTL